MVRLKPFFGHAGQGTLSQDQDALLLSGQANMKTIGDREVNADGWTLRTAACQEEDDGKKTGWRKRPGDELSWHHKHKV